MSEHETTAEDLDLDGTEADAVVGGHSNPDSEIRHLAREGYVEQACTSEGTVMYNPKTKHHTLVKF
jgi:hypothetical protein